MNRFSYRLSSLASIGASRLRGFFYLLFSCFILSSIGFSQGDYSLSFDGVDDYVTIEDSDDWAFGSGDFAIQFWAKFDEYTSIYRPLVGQISNGGWSRNLITQGPKGYVDFVEGDNILIYTSKDVLFQKWNIKFRNSNCDRI